MLSSRAESMGLNTVPVPIKRRTNPLTVTGVLQGTLECPQYSTYISRTEMIYLSETVSKARVLPDVKFYTSADSFFLFHSRFLKKKKIALNKQNLRSTFYPL
jgi:hypothetical protein